MRNLHHQTTEDQELVAAAHQDGQRYIIHRPAGICLSSLTKFYVQYTSPEKYIVHSSSFGIWAYGKVQVAIVLQGRQAGKKVVILQQVDEGTKERPYAHAIVAGVERYPRKVTRRMGQKKVARRSKVKPFIKVCFRGSLFRRCMPRDDIKLNSSFACRSSTTRICSRHVTQLSWRA